MSWHTEEILVIVKAYPTASTKHGETVCTAGITREGKWIRLYPIPYRDLSPSQKYQKFQWIRVSCQLSQEKLHRPESHKIDPSSIEVLEKIQSGIGWSERKKYFLPCVSQSLEELEKCKQTKHISLGAFKPKEVTDFLIRPTEEIWDPKKQAILSQSSLFNKGKHPLEKIPYTFHYQFICDDSRCKGHDLTIVDWETSESYRNFKNTYKTEQLTLQKLKEKWLDYFFRQRESYYVVGTDSHWNKFIILGIVSPQRKTDQLTLGF